MRSLSALTAAGVSALGLTLFTAAPASATPPGIPTLDTARSQLAALAVAAESHQSTYERSLFPHWITISGACNTRETVLKRDGTGVVTNSSCAATLGRWYSPFDGATWTVASDLDIDHLVPLAEAWRSGAWAWTTTRRQAFANDLSRPQLWAVTDDVNQAKGDKDPSVWQPPAASFRCTYAKSWITTKYADGLSVQASEKTALTSMLNTC